MDITDLKAALGWQIELGADEAIGDTPVNRYEMVTKPKVEKPVKKPTPPQRIEPEKIDTVAQAQAAAARSSDLTDLKSAMGAYDHCELKKGARTLVFADGHPTARIMIIGEAPGSEEDREGRPFVGRAGQLLDKMFAAIDLSRTNDGPKALYITNVLPWRPPQNRDPLPEEIAMMLPFLARHVALVDPDMLVLMGNTACQAVLGHKGITRLRGTWTTAFDRPALPMFHPAYLLRNPVSKRESWADLLSLKSRLNG